MASTKNRRVAGVRIQQGFTLVELMVVLAIMALIAIYQANKAKVDAENLQTTAAADNIKTLGLGLATYISNNTAALSGAATTPVTVATLQGATACGTAPCMTSSFAPPAWTGGYTMLVRRLGGAAPYQFEALACTNNGWVINGVTRGDLVGSAVLKVGGAGAMTYDATSGAYPNGSGTPLPVAAYPASNATSKLCYYVSQSTTAMDMLYLRTDGTNQMNGALNMGGQAVNNATNITASGSINAGSITSAGAVNAGSVASTGAITTGSTINANGTITGGNLTTAGTVTGATVTSTGNINIGSGGTLQSSGRIHIQAGEHLYLQPFANGYGSPTYVGGGGAPGNLQVYGDASVTGNVLAGNSVQATNDVTITSLSSRPSAPGVTSLKALAPKMVELYNYTVTADGQTVPVPACSTGGTPQVFILPHVATGTAGGGLWGTEIRMTGPAGGVWTTVARDSHGLRIGVNSTDIPAGNFTAVVRTFCTY